MLRGMMRVSIQTNERQKSGRRPSHSGQQPAQHHCRAPERSVSRSARRPPPWFTNGRGVRSLLVVVMVTQSEPIVALG
jgi:hypothetical protein